MSSLVDLDPAELGILLAQWGGKASNAARLLRHFYDAAGEVDLSELRLGKLVEQKLGTELSLRRSIVRHRVQASDGTTKLLVGFADSAAVESVLMPAYNPTRAAGCISSQIGCAMGCDFCASTRHGLERNLEPGEIVEQSLHLKRIAIDMGRRLSTLVFMGMGEPMHNLDNVLTAIRRIASPGMGHLGFRQITVSTVGVVPGMVRLAEANLNVHLALSLHAPDDETRSKIIPANRRYPVQEVMQAARAFQEKTGRIVTIEYTMLAGVNDSIEQAVILADLLEGFRAHVNLIPYNWIGPGLSGREYACPSRKSMDRFMDVLVGRNVVVHYRRTRGDDVNAACGQLREIVTGAPQGQQ